MSDAPAGVPARRTAGRSWRRELFAFARLGLALFLLWMVLADTGARLARQQLAALATMDYAAEVKALRIQGRYGEAAMIANEGIMHVSGDELARLMEEYRQNEAERDSVLRRLREAATGAITGQGVSLESAAGAITADLFIIGDLRDLLIQSAKYVVDGEVDPVITVLSAIGVATTIAPELDIAAGVLKAARKAGALGGKVLAEVVRLAKARAIEPLKAIMKDIAELAKGVGPSGAVRLLRLAEEPADIARMNAFVRRVSTAAGEGGAGASRGFAALHVTGREGLEALKGATAGAEAAHDAAVVAAAVKGKGGVAWLRAGGIERSLRPHPILGIVKALYKGNAQALVAGVLSRMDGIAWWLVPCLGTWVVIEGWWLWKRWVGGEPVP